MEPSYHASPHAESLAAASIPGAVFHVEEVMLLIAAACHATEKSVAVIDQPLDEQLRGERLPKNLRRGGAAPS